MSNSKQIIKPNYGQCTVINYDYKHGSGTQKANGQFVVRTMIFPESRLFLMMVCNGLWGASMLLI